MFSEIIQRRTELRGGSAEKAHAMVKVKVKVKIKLSL
jgi:hypothetical protein